MAAKKEEPNPTQQAAMHRLENMPVRPAHVPMSVGEMRDRETQRVATMLQRDHKPAPPKKGKRKKDVPAVTAVDPTPEWLARYSHVKDSPTTSSGYKMAERPVYRKHPWFESLCGRDDTFTDEDLAALRYYRNAYEQSQRSETRCALAAMVHGSGGGNGEPSLAAARAKSVLEHLEPALGSLLTTMRAIALEDMTYEQVAMARFGYRYDDFYDSASGTFTQRPRNTSGKNPGKIKAEFVAGAKLLTAAMLGRRVANENAPIRIDANGAPLETIRQFSLTETLRAEIKRRAEAGRPVGSIDIPLVFLRDIGRENGLQPAPDDTEEAEFDGIPMRVFKDRFLGWVLNDGECGE